MTEFSRPNADGKPYILAMDNVTCDRDECLVVHCKTLVDEKDGPRVYAIHIHPDDDHKAGRLLATDAMDAIEGEKVARAQVLGRVRRAGRDAELVHRPANDAICIDSIADEPVGFHHMPYPPLATLDEKPLHDDGAPLPKGEAWACNIPSTDDDEEISIRFDWRCPNCVGGAKVMMVGMGDCNQTWRPTNDTEPQVVKLSWLIERADYWANQ